MANDAVVRKADDSTALWVLGGLYEVKISGEESGGALTVMEMTIPPGAGPPAHTHPGAETVYVLEGTLRYHIGDEVFEGGPGSCFFLPEGTLERFEPTGDTPLRILAVYTPGGIDGFFAEVGEIAAARVLPPPSDTPPDVERIMAVGERYGMHFEAPS